MPTNPDQTDDPLIDFSGQIDYGLADPSDESHFTIHYKTGLTDDVPNSDGLIEGWLRDDDTIEWKQTGGWADRIHSDR